MKKTSRGFATLAAVTVCTVAPVIGASHERTKSVTPPQPELSAGRDAATSPYQGARPPDPKDLFKRQCAACHGESGEGDGPAAPAFDPAPANLTDPELVGERSDAELRQVLTGGRRSMPAFGQILKAEEIDSLVSYIRKLSGGGSAG